MANSEIYAYNTHYLPLLSRIIQQMELPNTINKTIDREDNQATVAPRGYPEYKAVAGKE